MQEISIFCIEFRTPLKSISNQFNGIHTVDLFEFVEIYETGRTRDKNFFLTIVGPNLIRSE